MGLKSLESTFIYNNLNKSNAVSDNIMLLLTKGRKLTSKELEEPLLIISKNFKFPLKMKVLDAFNNGDVICMYGTASKLPTALPFFLTKRGNDIVSVVAVDLYGTFDKDNQSINIDPKKLYCMMEAAYLARLCYIYDRTLLSTTTILTLGGDIYSSMFTRVLNKHYSLNIDKNKMHKVVLLSSKFYLINVLGLPDNETVFNYALKNCPNGNLYSLKETNDMLDIKDYTNLLTFINALCKPELGLNLKNLTIRTYLEMFINMYDSSALLSLESFPYFLYNVLSVTNGAYINNQYAMEDIVGNNGAKLYVDLMRLTN